MPGRQSQDASSPYGSGQTSGAPAFVATYFAPAVNLSVPPKLMQYCSAPSVSTTRTGAGLAASVWPSPVPRPATLTSFPALTRTARTAPVPWNA